MLKAYGILSRRLGLAPYPFKSRHFYGPFKGRVARDLGDRGIEIIHLHNFFQYVPVIRRHNAHSRIILHMHCECLTQLDRRTIGKRLADTDAVFNGVDTGAFALASGGAGENAGCDPTPLFVGRITPEKAIHDLPRVVAENTAAAAHLLRDFNSCVYVGDVLEEKRHALDAYASQMTRLVDDPSWTRLEDVAGGEFLKCFFQEYEVFWERNAEGEIG